ncbi:MAG TPA: SurA N-terminal domain-containing protein [Verrucomicrobiae bacterium]
MFTHIRRHQKWLWIFISAAVIISFVWYFNPNQQMGGGGGAGTERAHVGSMYGEPITQREYWNARREVEMDYLFRYGKWADEDEFARQMGTVPLETRRRLLLTRKLKDYGIQVDDRATAEWISTFFADRETKQFNRQTLDRIMELLSRKRMTQADFERYARNQVGIQHLAAVAGAPGKLIPPQEAERALRQEHEKIDTKVVLFPLTNFVAKVQVTPEAVANYYTNAMARYRLPERMQLSYVAFPASNYFAQAEQRMASETNLNQQIDLVYTQRGANFYTGPDGQPLTAEAAKQKIREEIREGFAMNEARKTAYAFANDLEAAAQTQPDPGNPAAPLEQLAANKGLNAQVTQPFSQFEGPSEIQGMPDDAGRALFMLTPESPIRVEPIIGETGIYMVALKRKLPSEVQTLDAIRERVTEDFKRGEGLKLARETATAFATAVSNAPTNFESAAQQQGLTLVNLPPFSRDASAPIENLPPTLDSGAVRSSAMELSEGEVSSYIPTREGGFVLTVEKVIPPTNEEIQSELPKFVEDFRRRRAGEAFSDWFAKEMQLAQLTVNDGSEQSAEQ